MIGVGMTTDRLLWERAATGDGDAFAEVYRRHARPIYNFLYRRTGSWSDAQDLTSAVFLQAWRRRDEIVLHQDSALPWLLRTADYTARNESRSKRRYRRALAAADLPLDTERDHADDVVDRLDDQRQLLEAQAALKKLPKHERDVVELCVWSGLDQQAAAITLDVAVGTVKSRLSRARKRLREWNLASFVEQENES